MIKTLLLVFLAIFSEKAICRDSTTVVNYEVIMTYEKNEKKINITLKNKSKIELYIREDATPFSLLSRGANFSAFEEITLKRIPIYRPIGSNPKIINVSPNAEIVRFIEIEHLIKNHCQALKENSILVFWSYSARAGESGENILLPSDGVFRIDKSSQSCE